MLIVHQSSPVQSTSETERKLFKNENESGNILEILCLLPILDKIVTKTDRPWEVSKMSKFLLFQNCALDLTR